MLELRGLSAPQAPLLPLPPFPPPTAERKSEVSNASTSERRYRTIPPRVSPRFNRLNPCRRAMRSTLDREHCHRTESSGADTNFAAAPTSPGRAAATARLRLRTICFMWTFLFNHQTEIPMRSDTGDVAAEIAQILRLWGEIVLPCITGRHVARSANNL